MPSDPTNRVRFDFNPVSLISQFTSSFTQVPTSEPQLFNAQQVRYNDDVTVAIEAEVEPELTRSAPFPKPSKTRTRHKSEASPRRDTYSDSAMADTEKTQTQTSGRRRRHSSGTREILRQKRHSPIAALSYQNADVCGQLQVMFAVFAFIIELMLLTHPFDLPNHFLGLGVIAGVVYFLAGALGITSAHSQNYRTIITCMILSCVSAMIAIGVACGALHGLLTLNQTSILDSDPLFDEELVNGADYQLEDHYLPQSDHDQELDDSMDSDFAPDPQHPDQTINQLLYVLMICVSALEFITALVQSVICACATCCKQCAFRHSVRAITVIYNRCPEKKERDDLVHRDVLEHGSSGELADREEEAESDADCDEVWVIPGVHLNNNATEDGVRHQEEYEPDSKGRKVKMKKKKMRK